MASIFSSLSFRQRSFSLLSLFFSIIFPSIVLSASLTLDAVEENTSAATFGDFVFENGLIVRVTEEGDLVIGSDGSEGGSEPTELYIDAITANNDYDSDDNGSTTTMTVVGEEETTEGTSSSANMDAHQTENSAPMSYGGDLGGSVDVNVSSYHNYSALVDLLRTLEEQYGHIVTR